MSDSDKRGLPSRRGTAMAAQHPAANAPSAIAVRTAPRARYQKGWLLRCTGLDDVPLLRPGAPCRTFQTSAAVRPLRSAAQRLEHEQSARAADREQRHWLLRTHLRHVSASRMPPGSRGTRQDTCFSVSSTPESSLATSCGETFLLLPRQQSRSSARRSICRERAAP